MVGFVTFGPSRDDDTVGMGEIYALYVDPGRYEGGVGRLLMAEARRRLKGEGFEAAVLWVLTATTAPRASTNAKAGSPMARPGKSSPTKSCQTSAASSCDRSTDSAASPPRHAQT